jgi:energy-converting hydrogenase Eha subunit B
LVTSSTTAGLFESCAPLPWPVPMMPEPPPLAFMPSRAVGRRVLASCSLVEWGVRRGDSDGDGKERTCALLAFGHGGYVLGVLEGGLVARLAVCSREEVRGEG